MLSSIQAKFACESVTNNVGSQTASLKPVTANSEENKSFSQYTPSGKLELTITNKNAIDFFVPGNEYVLNIEAVPK